jgi:prepilin-type processing-associated H-X9-DG protein
MAPGKGRATKRIITIVAITGGVLLLLVVPVIVLLVRSVRCALEAANRASCQGNLSIIGKYGRDYAAAHSQRWPDVFTDQSKCWDDIGNTRTDRSDPYEAAGDDPALAPNSNTANLWLLIARQGLTPQVFICPTALGVHRADSRVHHLSDVRDFRAPECVSYSYQNVFGDYQQLERPRRNEDTLAIAADANPQRADFRDIAQKKLAQRPKFVETEETEKWNQEGRIRDVYELNSPNHGWEGQNVLYLDGHVEWKEHPYCGPKFDNIWLARLPSATPQETDPGEISEMRKGNDTSSYKSTGPGTNHSALPAASDDDSFLVP